MIVSGAAVNQTLASSRQMPDQFHLVSALLIKKWKTAGKKLAAAYKILSHDGISSSVTAEMFESAAKTPQNSVCN